MSPQPAAPRRTPGSRPASRGRLAKTDRRKLLLSAANDVFADSGFHKSSMEDIADRAGVSKPVLYQHFPSKLELYLTVLDGHVEELVLRVRQALRSTTDNNGRLIAAVRAFFDVIDNDTQGYKLIFNTDVMLPEVQSRISRATDACVDAVFDLVRQDSGLGLHQARMIAVGLVGLIQVSARHWQDTGQPIAKEEAVFAAVSLAWGGLSRVPKLD
ncbi:transcriptional regulator, TetR family [Segniliparus rotundus DSM 44985]|uniref:Transcriptional regulator, TetR family n=1 Tax=Segniliparus rotundus (strain ATCC BAA-972 / CDC 1076 / CIP 108378 / DSM 44985 / JCM 13578) TaxID=640132 RepID=D6ZAG3_SEGRD|nr:TetR/AcrR family transcriptional regulator [Segniliparus rotundus]ADG96705.1 transcriptional regulator, TetR family [Segniliparus rotundus DSM 44985]